MPHFMHLGKKIKHYTASRKQAGHGPCVGRGLGLVPGFTFSLKLWLVWKGEEVIIIINFFAKSIFRWRNTSSISSRHPPCWSPSWNTSWSAIRVEWMGNRAPFMWTVCVTVSGWTIISVFLWCAGVKCGLLCKKWWQAISKAVHPPHSANKGLDITVVHLSFPNCAFFFFLIYSGWTECVLAALATELEWVKGNTFFFP